MHRAAGIVLLGLLLVAVAGVFDASPLYVPGVGFVLVGVLTTAWVELSARRMRITRTLDVRRVVEDEPVPVQLEVRSGALPLPLAIIEDPLFGRSAAAARRYPHALLHRRRALLAARPPAARAARGRAARPVRADTPRRARHGGGRTARVAAHQRRRARPAARRRRPQRRRRRAARRRRDRCRRRAALPRGHARRPHPLAGAGARRGADGAAAAGRGRRAPARRARHARRGPRRPARRGGARRRLADARVRPRRRLRAAAPGRAPPGHDRRGPRQLAVAHTCASRSSSAARRCPCRR